MQNLALSRQCTQVPTKLEKRYLEEAGEVWMAANYETRERTAEEISQLLYHIQVIDARLRPVSGRYLPSPLSCFSNVADCTTE